MFISHTPPPVCVQILHNNQGGGPPKNLHRFVCTLLEGGGGTTLWAPPPTPFLVGRQSTKLTSLCCVVFFYCIRPAPCRRALCWQLRVVLHRHYILQHGHHPPCLDWSLSWHPEARFQLPEILSYWKITFLENIWQEKYQKKAHIYLWQYVKVGSFLNHDLKHVLIKKNKKIESIDWNAPNKTFVTKGYL